MFRKLRKEPMSRWMRPIAVYRLADIQRVLGSRLYGGRVPEGHTCFEQEHFSRKITQLLQDKGRVTCMVEQPVTIGDVEGTQLRRVLGFDIERGGPETRTPRIPTVRFVERIHRF